MPCALDLVHRRMARFRKTLRNERTTCINSTETRTISYPIPTTMDLSYGMVEEVGGPGLFARQ